MSRVATLSPALPTLWDGSKQVLQSDYFAKSRKASSILRQIFHSRDCRGSCGQVSCNYTVQVLEHIEMGCNSLACPVSGCDTTRKLLSHYRTCCRNKMVANQLNEKVEFCLICSLASSSPESSIGPEDIQGYHREMRSQKEMKRAAPHSYHELNPVCADHVTTIKSGSAGVEALLSPVDIKPKKLRSDVMPTSSEIVHVLSGGKGSIESVDQVEDGIAETLIIFRESSFENYKVSWYRK